MRFNMGFTPGTVVQPVPRRRTPAINHAHPPFIENKRYRMKPRRIGDVVNRKAVSVYQTDAVLILIGDVQGRLERALWKTHSIKTKQYRVRQCSKPCLLRCSPAHPV
jgi:hypothetical protein